MKDINSIQNKSPGVIDNSRAQKNKVNTEDSGKFNDELINSLNRIGSDIDKANLSMKNGPNDIGSIESNLTGVQDCLNRLQGVVKEITGENKTESAVNQKRIADAYGKNASTLNDKDKA